MRFSSAIRGPLSAQKALQGAGIRILTPTISSPTLADQLRNFLKIYPQAKWHVYEPINRDNVLEGAKLAFGQPVETRYDFSKADVIVSLDADFLYAGFPGNTRYIRDFASRRNPDSGNMNRLYVIESTPSSTGAKADHRIPVGAEAIREFTKAIVPVVEGAQDIAANLDKRVLELRDGACSRVEETLGCESCASGRSSAASCSFTCALRQ